jgi:ankyrin repeat protein
MNFSYLRIVFCTSLFFASGSALAMEKPTKESKVGEEESCLGNQFVKAAKKGDLERVNFFLESGVPVDYVNEKGFTALMKAQSGNHIEVVRRLIQAKANVNMCHERLHYTVLKCAVAHNRIEMVSMLIDAGADVFSNPYGWPPLVTAAYNGDQRICELLVEKMLSIPDWYQKKRMYLFLNCLKRNYRFNYSNLRNIFKNYFRYMVIQENIVMTNPVSVARRAINRLKISDDTFYDKSEEMKQHLLNKYFRK